jgi:hypothetical protein
MKCIQVVGQGIPVRMSDADAAQVIAEGDGEYCAKAVWKRFHDRNADPDYRQRRRCHLNSRGEIIRIVNHD